MNGRKFFGILLIVLGIGFILQQLNLLDFGNIIGTWWPIIIIIIGIIQIATNSSSILGGIIVIAIGVLFQLSNLDYVGGNVWRFFWPIILILVGMRIILSRTSLSNIPTVNDDVINYFAAFSGLNNINTSVNFKGGSIMAIFGGAEIDLRNAVLAHDGAIIDATAAFGGVDIMVPTGWKIIVTGIPIFGGWENKTSNAQLASGDSPVLKIRCFAAFGGIDIKN